LLQQLENAKQVLTEKDNDLGTITLKNKELEAKMQKLMNEFI
jgi:hypothetical protein